MVSKDVFQKLSSLVFVFLLISCAKDKTVDSYQDEKLLEDYAKLKVAEGTYSGYLSSVSSSQNLGVLEISLQAATRKSSTVVGESRENAVLVTSLRFIGNDEFSISVGDAYFDPTTKVYQANIEVLRKDASKETLSISGRIEGDVFTGNLEVVGYSNFGSRFVIKRNAQSADELAEQSGSFPDLSYGKDYLALNRFLKAGYDKEVVSPVSFRLMQSYLSNQEKFVDFLIPQKIIQLSLSYGDSLVLTFPNAVWDQRTQSLVASTQIANGARIDISCRSQGLPVNPSAWTCNQATNELSQVAFLQTFELADYEKNFRDDVPALSVEIRKTYKGEATSENGKSKSSLEVIYPASSRAEFVMDLYFPNNISRVAVTLYLFDEPGRHRLPLLFPAESTVWDAANRTIKGERDEFRSGDSYHLTLNCSGFDFEAQKTPFSCVYTSNQLSNPFNIVFQP